MVIEKYINDQGQVGVLISSDFGAGWSTWNGEHKDFLLFDRGLIELAQRDATASEVEAYLKSKGIDAYTGGWEDIKICWMSPGTQFSVEEYDGSERLRFRDDGDLWSQA